MKTEEKYQYYSKTVMLLLHRIFLISSQSGHGDQKFVEDIYKTRPSNSRYKYFIIFPAPFQPGMYLLQEALSNPIQEKKCFLLTHAWEWLCLKYFLPPLSVQLVINPGSIMRFPKQLHHPNSNFPLVT